MFRIFGVIYTSLRNVTILQLQIVICCKKKFLKASTWAKTPKTFPLEPAKLGLIFENFDFFPIYEGRLSHRDVDGGDVSGAICCSPDGQ